MFDVLVSGERRRRADDRAPRGAPGPVGARAHEGRAVALGDALRAGRRRRRARRARLARAAPRRHAHRGRGPVRRRRGARARHRGPRPRARARRARRAVRHRESRRRRRAAARARGRPLAGARRARGRRRDRRRDRAGARRRGASLATIEVREGWFAIELLVERGRCTGVLALRPDGEVEFVRAVDVVLATGGAGQCFAVTTNPTLSTGDGIALALKAGVACADLEFVQFHPTALHHPSMPRPLLSEALRGEGAVLRDDDGVAFMADVHPLADLAPRDVVVACDPRADARDRRRPRVARRDDDRRLRAPLPDDLGRVPDASASTRRRTGCRSRRPRTTCRAASSPISTARRRCRTSGRAARPRAAACTARTGSRRTRCSTGSCSAGGSSRRSSRARTIAESTGAMSGRARRRARRRTRARSGRAAEGAGERVTEPAELRGAVQRVMSADCGVVRDADGSAHRVRDARRPRARSPTTCRRARSRPTRCATCCACRGRSSAPAIARLESRGAHFAARLSRSRPTRSSAVSSFARRRRARRSSRCPAPSRQGAVDHVTDFDPPRPGRAPARRTTRSPKTSACSATSRRSRASARTRPRSPRSSRATKACSPAPRSRPRRTAQVDAQRRRQVGGPRRRVRSSRARSSAASRARCASILDRRTHRAELPHATARASRR